MAIYGFSTCILINFYRIEQVTAWKGRLTNMPEKPLLKRGSINVNGNNNSCGNGSQTVPRCSKNPGLVEST
jgi:hypothetical protein